MRVGVCVSAAVVSVAMSACSIVPPMPPDFALPMQEILLRTACELQEALISLDTPEYRRFKPHLWSISVQLLPRVDTGVAVSGG